MRIKVKKGEQRKFLGKVLENLGAPSLRELINRGVGVPYSTLKNYYLEERMLPENLFNDLCGLSGIEKEDLEIELVQDSWGQVKGGRKRKI